MIRRYLACAVASLVVAATTPAAAARYVFDVTVNLKTTDASGAQFSIDAISFQQVWIAAPIPGPMAEDTSGGPGASVIGFESSGPTRHSPTPFDAEIFDVTGLSPADLDPAVFQAADVLRFVNFAPDSAAAFVSFVDSTYRVSAPAPGIELVQRYATFLTTPGSQPVAFAPRPLRPIDARELGRLLEEVGPLEFTTGGVVSTVDATTNTNVFGGIAIYFGTAQYRPDLSAVPEPQAWALWIFGFAILGVAVRPRVRKARLPSCRQRPLLWRSRSPAPAQPR